MASSTAQEAATAWAGAPASRPDAMRADVIVPTLRRPDSLTRALRSLFAQDRGTELMASIVVVDNSPEASARETVEALRPTCPVVLTFVHAPRPGIATARNAGLAACHAPLVAFLDDDEAAPPHWLASLCDAHLRLGVAVTFGPVRGRAPDAAPRTRAYMDGFFSRSGPDTTQVIGHPYGCGASIMTRAVALAGPAPFDVEADASGGEDDRLFARLSAGGARFGWAAQAWVTEYAPAHRARLSYTLRRAFGYGQSPSQIAARAGRWLGVAKWMAVGAAQFAVFAPLAGLLLLGGLSPGAELADRAARGLGKLAWWRSPRFYGSAEARRSLNGRSRHDPGAGPSAP